MQLFEIIAGVLLMLSCIVIVGVVLSQEAKGQGLSSVITGSQLTSSDSRSQAKEARQVRFTTIAAIALFVLTIAVNIINLLGV